MLVIPIYLTSRIVALGISVLLGYVLRQEEAIKDRIAKTGKAPKAIVPVALYGMPYRIDEIMAIADWV